MCIRDSYVGKIGFGCEDYVSENYEWKSIGEKYAEYPDLPKVVYVYNLSLIHIYM